MRLSLSIESSTTPPPMNHQRSLAMLEENMDEPSSLSVHDHGISDAGRYNISQILPHRLATTRILGRSQDWQGFPPKRPESQSRSRLSDTSCDLLTKIKTVSEG